MQLFKVREIEKIEQRKQEKEMVKVKKIVKTPQYDSVQQSVESQLL